MFKWLADLFPLSPKEQHADHKREQTHQALNELQGAILDYQQTSQRNKEQIIQILSDSEAELHSVAQKVAAATGARKRGYNT